MSLLFVTLTRRRVFSFLVLTIFLTLLPQDITARIQTPYYPPNSPFAQPQDRITKFVDDEQRVTLNGNRHPLALVQYDAGAVSPDFRMDRMLLTLLPDAAQEDALTQLLDAQHNPESPYYHQWLTPEQYGERFGVSEADAAQVTAWLTSYGMEVEELTAGRRSIIFSGTAAEVESAFHTQIHTYKIGGEIHHASASDPEIPMAFAQVVGGVVSLHDFRSKPMHNGARIPTPDFTSGGSHYLAPADFATIYDLGPLYQQSINGNGQSGAIVARSNISIADVRQFRTSFGLPANDPQIIVNGSDPGIVSSGEETEADLDVEWSGAVAKDSVIKFVVSKSTSSSDGSYLSAQYIVSHNLAPVMSMSFGVCEAALGSSGNSFIDSLWQQAAAQGITVFVSSGDSGAAGCDSPSASRATHGRGVNGLCSTPYSVCVGGTEFNDASHPSLYWSPSNTSGTEASALSYRPEVAWNESAAGGLWASGGGSEPTLSQAFVANRNGPSGRRQARCSRHFSHLCRPRWLSHLPERRTLCRRRYVGCFRIVCWSDGVGGAECGGSSRQCQYRVLLAGQQAEGRVEHPFVTTSPAATTASWTDRFQRDTGRRSSHRPRLHRCVCTCEPRSGATAAPTLHATASSNLLAIVAGSNDGIGLNVTVSGGFNAAIAFSVRGLPSGISAQFTPATLSMPGSGARVLKPTATTRAKPGTYYATVSASSGSTTQKIPLAITCRRHIVPHR